VLSEARWSDGARAGRRQIDGEVAVEASQLAERVREYEELESALADPGIHADQDRVRKLGRRYAELTPVIRTMRELDAARSDLEAARELAKEDEAFAAEADELTERIPRLEAKLTELLLPRDPHDGADVVLEVKSGEGGAESALFAGDLLRMYLRYAERHGWKSEVLDATDSDLGGIKDATVVIKSTGSDPDGVWSRLKWEGGVHRVQRVPVTESQGRIHTSAAGVLVYPEAEETAELGEIPDKDLRVDVYRSSGKGGQSVNTTDSAVRITHLPTGIVVSCQNERSQLQNKARAMQVLRARLLALAEEEAAARASDARRSQIRTVDRSERVRTYNFPENRISDHRVGYKAYNLDVVLEGDLDGVLDALVSADRAERLAAEQAG
jgi:peptide chain release factor 1